MVTRNHVLNSPSCLSIDLWTGAKYRIYMYTSGKLWKWYVYVKPNIKSKGMDLVSIYLIYIVRNWQPGPFKNWTITLSQTFYYALLGKLIHRDSLGGISNIWSGWIYSALFHLSLCRSLAFLINLLMCLAVKFALKRVQPGKGKIGVARWCKITLNSSTCSSVCHVKHILCWLFVF